MQPRSAAAVCHSPRGAPQRQWAAAWQPDLAGLLQVSRGELDKVRNVKSLTTHIINRVGRVQRELEEILDDDQDMADMYLGR